MEWARFDRRGYKPKLTAWVLDVGKIKGDTFYSSDGKTRKRVSSQYLIVKKRIRSEVLKVPNMPQTDKKLPKPIKK